jgi:hypothetical protein
VPRKTFFILAAALTLFGTAFMGMAIGKTRITTVCKDVRLFMDGGYSVNIMTSGIKRKTVATVYQRSGIAKINLGSVEVSEKPTGSSHVFSGKGLELTVSRYSQPKVRGMPARLKAQIAGEKINAQLGCTTL